MFLTLVIVRPKVTEVNSFECLCLRFSKYIKCSMGVFPTITVHHTSCVQELVTNMASATVVRAASCHPPVIRLLCSGPPFFAECLHSGRAAAHHIICSTSWTLNWGWALHTLRHSIVYTCVGSACPCCRQLLEIGSGHFRVSAAVHFCPHGSLDVLPSCCCLPVAIFARCTLN